MLALPTVPWAWEALAAHKLNVEEFRNASRRACCSISDARALKLNSTSAAARCGGACVTCNAVAIREGELAIREGELAARERAVCFTRLCHQRAEARGEQTLQASDASK